MIDLKQQSEWFEEYLRAALKFPSTRGRRKQAEAWARSMSLIADQLVDNRDGEATETENV